MLGLHIVLSLDGLKLLNNSWTGDLLVEMLDLKIHYLRIKVSLCCAVLLPQLSLISCRKVLCFVH